jgi:hypothetical protein
LELLDPVAVPQLISTDILVELHEFIKPGVTRTIFSRFCDTHSVTFFGHQRARSQMLSFIRNFGSPRPLVFDAL